MAEFKNPALWSSAPADGQIGVYNAGTDSLDPTDPGEASGLTVPGTHIAQVASPNAQNPANVAYTQADQTALAALANETKAKLDTLLTELQTAGVLASS
jgi:hypothetical protein